MPMGGLLKVFFLAQVVSEVAHADRQKTLRHSSGTDGSAVIDGSISNNGQIVGELRSELQVARREEDTLRGQLSEVKHEAHESVLRLRTDVHLTAHKVRMDRERLQAQIRQLQDEILQARNAKAASKERLDKDRAVAVKDVSDLKLEMKRRDEEHRLAMQQLQVQLHVSKANVSAESVAVAASGKVASMLQQAVSSREQELRNSLADAAKLREKLSASDKNAAMLQQKVQQDKSDLGQTREEVTSMNKRLNEATAQQVVLSKQLQEMKRQRDEATKQEEALRKKGTAEQLESQKQMHSVMLSAASKVRQLEEKHDELESDIKKMQDALAAANDEAANAKNVLLQETDSALKATQSADDLTSRVAAARKAAAQSASNASRLASTVKALQTERAQAMTALHSEEDEAGRWESKAESLQKQATTLSQEDTQLKEQAESLQGQVYELSADHARADMLASKLSILQTAADANRTREAKLTQQLERIEYLKDHYSSEYDAAAKDSNTWQAKAEDEQKELLAVERQLSATAHQRDDALDHVHSARQQEDEYYDENSNLQKQVQELQSQIQDAWTAANQSATKGEQLQAQVQKLKSQEEEQKQTARAAFEANQRQLDEAKSQQGEAEAAKSKLQAEIKEVKTELKEVHNKSLHNASLPSHAAEKKHSQTTHIAKDVIKKSSALHATAVKDPVPTKAKATHSGVAAGASPSIRGTVSTKRPSAQHHQTEAAHVPVPNVDHKAAVLTAAKAGTAVQKAHVSSPPTRKVEPTATKISPTRKVPAVTTTPASSHETPAGTGHSALMKLAALFGR